MTSGNVFSGARWEPRAEVLDEILSADGVRIERIVSSGQASAASEWYDQESPEWVLLLQGRAGLRFESDPELKTLVPGDYVHIPAHVRHRVEWTEPTGVTIWLAIHYSVR